LTFSSGLVFCRYIQYTIRINIEGNFNLRHTSGSWWYIGQNIIIKASSGLDDSEIERMVSDAASHAEEDKKFRELIDVRNQADSLIHGSEKTLSELGEKVSSDERLKIENAVSDLKTALEGEDKDAIEAKTKILTEASAEIAQKLYAEQAASSAEGEPSSENQAKDDIVDAEFEEVDDEKADK
jgi:molecular chaperone DnaK